MPYYKFHEDDLFINTIRNEPQYSFYIYSGSVYIDSVPHLSGTKSTNSNPNIHGVPNGFISLYEYNIDRLNAERIYPFVYKDGKRNSFKTISKIDYNTQYLFGDVITSSYNMSASISRLFVNSVGTAERRRINALRNTLNYYGYLSPHYEYSSSLGDKSSQDVNLISIPSIFYGSSIEKGTVKLDYYISGTLAGRLEDSRKNGELVQTVGLNSADVGKVAGVVLYNEGFILLTGSWNVSDASATYTYDTSTTTPKWKYWGFGGNDGNTMASTNQVTSSFLLEYSGNVETQTLTMLAQANYGELNYTNNPTSYSSSVTNKMDIAYATTGSKYQYVEKPIKVRNIVSASYTDQDAPYKKTVYISKIGIYDKDKNLIGIAKLATPVRKTEDADYTFKIKLDI
ncbi:MAG: hypothetical protein CBE07_003145 [Pelagibacteraceae bacterium TMED247]|nr:MAG: hypothetical protein CBE07_003145 [Pelagibacteraceae bacterium TMED247]|tara:strand:+ start:571 stop:1767 length:1197 start_codon:yes stop_codon:yes gene_type:complete